MWVKNLKSALAKSHIHWRRWVEMTGWKDNTKASGPAVLVQGRWVPCGNCFLHILLLPLRVKQAFIHMPLWQNLNSSSDLTRQGSLDAILESLGTLGCICFWKGIRETVPVETGGFIGVMLWWIYPWNFMLYYSILIYWFSIQHSLFLLMSCLCVDFPTFSGRKLRCWAGYW